ncbi:MAG TPA: MBL fold metallo-hydrolase [Nocardioidaceae bacterium]|nr:MBL fold metallo-hydrolase [Nocardioidaceae bacterium]
MKLTIVGCSGSYAGPDSAASCYLLEADHEGRTWRILLDLGSGAFGALQRYADPRDIDALFISHLHADHFYDISGYYVVRVWHPEGEMPPLPTWGPKGMAKQIAAGYGLKVHPGMKDAFDVSVYTADPITVGPFTIRTRKLKHPIRSYGFHVEAGGSTLVYSGDTGPCDALVELSRGVDVLLCEAAFCHDRDNPPDLHLTGREAGDTAKAAEVGQLVLTHIPPWHEKQVAFDEAASVYDGPITLAEPGKVYEF